MCAGAIAVISATCGRTMPRQRGDLACIVHAHFEHRKLGVARHPGEAQRHAGVVVVALDRAVDLARAVAVERGVERFLGAGLADRAGDADDRRARLRSRDARPSACERRERVFDQHVRAVDRLRDDRAGGARRRSAASTNLCPSWTVPGMATNRSPGPTSRLSKVTPVTSNGALARAAGRGGDLVARSRARSCGALPRDQRIVERKHPVADDLARSHGPCRRRARCRPRAAMRIASAIASRRPATSVAPGAPAMIVGADLRRVLAARIVVGDDHDVATAAPRPRPFPAACPGRGRRPRRTR